MHMEETDCIRRRQLDLKKNTGCCSEGPASATTACARYALTWIVGALQRQQVQRLLPLQPAFAMQPASRAAGRVSAVDEHVAPGLCYACSCAVIYAVLQVVGTPSAAKKHA